MALSTNSLTNHILTLQSTNILDNISDNIRQFVSIFALCRSFSPLANNPLLTSRGFPKSLLIYNIGVVNKLNSFQALTYTVLRCHCNLPFALSSNYFILNPSFGIQREFFRCFAVNLAPKPRPDVTLRRAKDPTSIALLWNTAHTSKPRREEVRSVGTFTFTSIFLSNVNTAWCRRTRTPKITLKLWLYKMTAILLCFCT